MSTATITREIHTLAEAQLGRRIKTKPNAWGGLDLDDRRVRLTYDDGDVTLHYFPDGRPGGDVQATFRGMPAETIAPVAAAYLA